MSEPLGCLSPGTVLLSSLSSLLGPLMLAGQCLQVLPRPLSPTGTWSPHGGWLHTTKSSPQIRRFAGIATWILLVGWFQFYCFDFCLFCYCFVALVVLDLDM